MLLDRLDQGVLEYCHSPYRNPYFLVEKKKEGSHLKKKEDRDYRMINAAIKINRVTIRDANLLPSINEFSKEFTSCAITSLINLFSRYN